MREPYQVFKLLETLYAEFDQIARRRRYVKDSSSWVLVEEVDHRILTNLSHIFLVSLHLQSIQGRNYR